MRRIAGEGPFDRADQGHLALERNQMHQAAVRLLQQVDLVVVEQAAHHDLARLHDPDPGRPTRSTGATVPSQPPVALTSARGIDLALAAAHGDDAPDVGAVGANAPGLGDDGRAPFRRVQRRQHGQARGVDDAGGIVDREANGRFSGCPSG